MNKRDDKKMTGLFWTGLVLSTGEASNFYIEEFSGPADCLGKTLIALLTVGTGVSEKTLANVKCRMEARTCAAVVGGVDAQKNERPYQAQAPKQGYGQDKVS